MLEFILLCVYLYTGIGMALAVCHCFILILAINMGDSESTKELTIHEMISQVFSWIIEWPFILQTLVITYKNDK
jgi:hypothetical protein